MELPDILTEESVLYCTGISSKNDLFARIAQHAGEALQQDPVVVLEALNNREALGSTGLGEGIAIPHGKVPGLTQVMAILVRLDKPIEYEAVDDRPVDIVVALLAPMGAGAEHLKALSRVARALRSEATVEALRATEDPARLYAILTAPQAAHKAA